MYVCVTDREKEKARAMHSFSTQKCSFFQMKIVTDCWNLTSRLLVCSLPLSFTTYTTLKLILRKNYTFQRENCTRKLHLLSIPNFFVTKKNTRDSIFLMNYAFCRSSFRFNRCDAPSGDLCPRCRSLKRVSRCCLVHSRFAPSGPFHHIRHTEAKERERRERCGE